MHLIQLKIKKDSFLVKYIKMIREFDPSLSMGEIKQRIEEDNFVIGFDLEYYDVLEDICGMDKKKVFRHLIHSLCEAGAQISVYDNGELSSTEFLDNQLESMDVTEKQVERDMEREKMDIAMFEQFDRSCFEKLPEVIGRILKAAKGKTACAIGFITTDDFYGFYLSWEYSKSIDEFYEWENGMEPEFLYQPLVNIVEACDEIDFCNASDEKWQFALMVLSVLEKNIKQIPDEVFLKHNFKRKDVLFFATMSDGDYMDEMLDASVKMFNASETLEAYGLM